MLLFANASNKAGLNHCDEDSLKAFVSDVSIVSLGLSGMNINPDFSLSLVHPLHAGEYHLRLHGRAGPIHLRSTYSVGGQCFRKAAENIDSELWDSGLWPVYLPGMSDSEGFRIRADHFRLLLSSLTLDGASQLSTDGGAEILPSPLPTVPARVSTLKPKLLHRLS